MADKVRIGVIGVGWYGMVDAKAALKVGGVQIAAAQTRNDLARGARAQVRSGKRRGRAVHLLLQNRE